MPSSRLLPTFPCNAQRHRVLVVDHHQDAADSFVMLLQSYGLEACAAYDGGEALATIPVFRPSLAFLEIRIRAMDGCSLAVRVRELPEGKNIRLVAMTVLGSRADSRIVANAGFHHRLLKPICIDELVKLISAPLPLVREWSEQGFLSDLFEFRRALSSDNSIVMNSKQAIAESYTLLKAVNHI